MDRRQRVVIGGLAAAVALLTMVVAGLAIPHHTSGRRRVTVAGSTTTTARIVGEATTEATISLAPVDTAPPTTASTTTSTTVPPTTTSTTAAGRVLTGGGAILTSPSGPVVRHLDASATCSQLGDGAGWKVTCDVVDARAGRLTWVVEERAVKADTARRAAVWRATGASGTWQQVLTAADDAGTAWTGLTERTADVDGDGGPEVAFGFRLTGTSQALAVDVVDGAGRVTLHDSGDEGSARLPGGSLEMWTAIFPRGEQACCPPAYEHDTVRFVSGAWRVVASEQVPPSAVPPSQV